MRKRYGKKTKEQQKPTAFTFSGKVEGYLFNFQVAGDFPMLNHAWKRIVSVASQSPMKVWATQRSGNVSKAMVLNLWRILYRQSAETVVIQHIIAKGTIDGQILKAVQIKDKTQVALIDAVKAEIGGGTIDS